MAKPLPTDLLYHSFESPDEFDVFLDQNGATLPAFYLKIAKKDSGVASITAEEAVEVALCHGWIDGWGRGMDEQWHMKRYTPRRAKSIWSAKNVATVGRLIEDGRMRPAGLAAVAAAKADGRWERAYGGASTSQIPNDLAAALDSNQAAKKAFESLKGAERYAILVRLQTAAPAARAQRIAAIIGQLEKGAAAKPRGSSENDADATVECSNKPSTRKRAAADSSTRKSSRRRR